MKNREQAVNEIRNGLMDIMKEVQAIEEQLPQEQTIYTDKTGNTYYECPGAYNEQMTRAMARDMFWFYPTFHVKYPELESVREWTMKLIDLNYSLMRMFDDEAGDRPLILWNEEGLHELTKAVREAAEKAETLYEAGHDKLLKDFLVRCRIWSARFLYMYTHAFCLMNREDIDLTLFHSQTSELDEGKKLLIAHICTNRARLTELLPKTTGKDHEFLMDKLRIFDFMGKAVMK